MQHACTGRMAGVADGGRDASSAASTWRSARRLRSACAQSHKNCGPRPAHHPRCVQRGRVTCPAGGVAWNMSLTSSTPSAPRIRFSFFRGVRQQGAASCECDHINRTSLCSFSSAIPAPYAALRRKSRHAGRCPWRAARLRGTTRARWGSRRALPAPPLHSTGSTRPVPCSLFSVNTLRRLTLGQGH